MQPRTLATDRGSYDLATWDGVNRAGLKPVGDNVLVMVDNAVSVTPGNIIIPDESQKTIGLGSTTGVMVCVGPLAFLYSADRMLKIEAEHQPKAGQRVWFTRYAGQEYYGYDGKLYRVMSDRQIGGVEDQESIAAGQAMAVVGAERVTRAKRA